MTSNRNSILIIDDEKDVALIITRLLKVGGYEVCEFSDPLKALEHFISNPKDYDLMISDIRMPRMNGFELARKFREIKPRIRVILMTAFEINNSEFELVLPHTKIDGFIQKPIKTEKLAEMI